MKKIELKKVNNELELIIYLNDIDWQKHLDVAKKNLAKKVEVKGFRKGKVPTDIAIKNIDINEARDHAIDEALKEHNGELIKNLESHDVLQSITQKIMKISDKELEIHFNIELYPELDLPNKVDFKVKYIEPKVSDSDINKRFNEIKDGFKKDVNKTDGVIDNKDIVNFDFLGKIDGKEFENGAAKGFDLEIGSNQFIEGFEEQMLGMKVNEEKIIIVTFPKTYPQEDLKGKKATFDIKINSIKSKVDFDANEIKEELKKYNLKTLDELKVKLSKMLQFDEISKSKEEFIDTYSTNMLELINKTSKFEIPKRYFELETDREFQNFVNSLSKQGLTLKKYIELLKTTEEELKKKMANENVVNRVHKSFIIHQLIKNNNIDVSDEDLEKKYDFYAKFENEVKEELKKRIPKDEIISTIIMEKLISILSK